MSQPPTVDEPIEIAKFWKSARNRKQSIVLAIRHFEGHTFLDCRLFSTNANGQSVPTPRGLTIGMAVLLKFQAGINKAVAEAKELDLISSDEGADT